jgi:hypothetical protein
VAVTVYVEGKEVVGRALLLIIDLAKEETSTSYLPRR